MTCRSFWPTSAGLLLSLGLALTPCSAAAAPDEATLKAAIVFNLLQFVEWPSETEASGGSLRLCLERASALWEPLRSLQGRPIRHLSLELREAPAPAEVPRQCHAWLFDPTRQAAVAAARAVQGRPVLLVCDGEARGADAAAIELGLAGGRVVFDVNQAPLRAAQLRISSKVLRLAREVRE